MDFSLNENEVALIGLCRDVARNDEHLASEAWRWTTGSAVVVDGGDAAAPWTMTFEREAQ